MKKILLAMAVLVMSVATVSAQSHKWFWFGPKAGLTSTAAEVTMEGDGMQSVLDGAASYNAGLMFRLNVPISIFSLHLQPELMYNWHKGDLKNPETGKVEIKDVTLNEFSVPILAGVGMDLGLFNARVQAGPVVYCAESVDNGENLHALALDTEFGYEVKYDEFSGLNALVVDGYRLENATDKLYARAAKEGAVKKPVKIKMIPYYSFANRGETG